jgi:uncharacterized membrane protein
MVLVRPQWEGPMWWNDFLSNAQWPVTWIIGPLMMIVCMAMMVFMMRGHGRRHRSGDDDALAILKARFARGDISRSEFEEQRRVLQA